MKPERLALVIFALTVAAAVTAFLARPKLGLDIRGGARVVLEAQTDKLPQGQQWNDDTKRAVENIIRKRVDANGVSEPVIAPKGNKQYVVELPSVQNDREIIAQLQNTAQLQFFYHQDWKTLRNQFGRYEFKSESETRNEWTVTDHQTKATFRDPFYINLALKEMLDRGAAAKTATTQVTLPAPLNELSAAAGLPAVTLTQEDAAKVAGLNQELQNFNEFLGKAQLKLTGSDLKSTSRASFNPSGAGQALVELEFNAEGTRKFADFTREHVNEILMIYLDGQILQAPNIENPILNGRAQISPFPTIESAQRLANLLNGGALPVPLKVVQQQSIEPTLGQDAVRQGLVAGIVGLGAVLVFMAWYYMLPGLVACAALLLYTLFTYAVFVSIPVTFTLPGIAGFILSVGMAVDANVLIFERTKEELRAGRPLRSAVEAGFSRAFSAIFDANFCTAITSLFLYNFGTGPVRGFALTLLIGVAISMFTAITVTRSILLLVIRTKAGQNLRAWGINRTWEPRLNVVGKRNRWYLLSALAIVPGLVFAFMGGFKPGIDFTGGSELTLKFNQRVTRGQVEQAVAAQGVADPVAQIAEGNTVFLRLPKEPGQTEIGQQKADAIVAALNTRFNGVTQQSFESIGSSISTELTRNALTAILFSSIFILLYLASRFAVGGFVNGLKFGTCAIIAMLHDVAFLIGTFVVLGYFLNWKIDTLFVTAALTVLSFSVHDTIVIFDRIREHLRNRARGEEFETLVNASINETISRSVNTSVTIFLTLLALLLLGGPVIRPLNAALFIGIIAGTYSSIFNAAPLVVDWERRFGRKGAGSLASTGTRGGSPQPAPAGAAGRTIPPLTPSAPGQSRSTGSNGAAPDAPRSRPTVSPPGPARRKRRM